MIWGFIKKLNLFFLTQGMAFVFAATLPSKIESIRYSGIGKTLTIKRSVVSPAYAAYQDSFNTTLELGNVEPTQGEVLKSGNVFVPQTYPEPKVEPVVIKVSEATPLGIYKAISPIRIKRSTPVEDPAMAMWKSSAVPVKPEPSFEPITTVAQLDTAPELEADENDWAKESYQIKVQKLLLQEARTQPMGMARTVATEKGSPIVVIPKKATKKAFNPPVDYQKLASTDLYSGLKDVIEPTTDKPTTVAMNTADKELSYWVSGAIKFSGGLAYSPKHHKVDIFRSYLGRTHEVGEVQIWEAQYSIKVDSPEGFLVVEVRGPNGDILGMGQYDMKELPRIAHNEDEIKDIEILVDPIDFGIQGEVISAYSYKDNEIPLNESKVYHPAVDEFINVNENSKFIKGNVSERTAASLEIISEEHWGSIKEALSGEPTKVQLFSEKYIHSLAEIVMPEDKVQDLKSFGIIMGKILNQGEADLGVEVELAGVDQKPNYFGTLLPNLNLEATGESGEFVFMMVPPGEYFIRARKEGQALPAELIRVEAGFVTYKELNTDQISRMTLEAMDAFQLEQIAGEVKFLGTDEMVSLNGEAEVYLPGGEGQAILEADFGEDFLITSYRFSKKGHFNRVLAVSKNWFFDLIESANLDDFDFEHEKGRMVIGFVENSDDFSVEAKSLSSFQEKPLVLYFNVEGELTPKPVSGGGYLILGLDGPSYHINVVDNKTGELFTQFLKLQEPSIPVLSTAFRGVE